MTGQSGMQRGYALIAVDPDDPWIDEQDIWRRLEYALIQEGHRPPFIRLPPCETFSAAELGKTFTLITKSPQP